jgi:DNA-binding SARP family transcriptional activator
MMPQANREACLKICLCGSLHLELNGMRLDEILLHHYRGALLAYLALQPGVIHKSDDVVAQLWPEDETPSLNNLSVVVNATRRALRSLACVLVSHNGTLRLEPTGLDIDVSAFDDAWTTRETDPERLEMVIERCSRPLLESYQGWYERRWVQEARMRYRRRFREAHRWLVNYAVAADDFQTAIHHLEVLRERGDLAAEHHCFVMEHLIETRQFVTATQFYEEYRDHLDAWADRLSPPQPMTDRYARIPHRPLHFAVRSRPAATVPEPITGALALETPYYIERASDDAFHTAIRRHDSIVRIEGSRQTGKTSLLARGLETARMDGAAVVSVDFQTLDASDLVSSESLLKAIAHAICEQLDLAISPAQHWDSLIAPKANFNSYVRNEVVRKSETHVVCAIDEADRIFNRDYRSDVFGLFRSWHNARALDARAPWDRFTLAMTYASEAHLLIPNLNESPFNVGTQIALQDFTSEEASDLNRRHGEPLRDREELNRLMAVVGGHPYLVQRSLYEIKALDTDVAYIEAEAGREIGIFSDHLHRVTRLVWQDPQLLQTVRTLIDGSAVRDSIAFSRLRSAGVLAGSSMAEARFRCGLYERHLRRQLQ